MGASCRMAAALARLSAKFYKRPAERMENTGITGTNGKSTTAFLIESYIAGGAPQNALSEPSNITLPAKILPAPHTTPEALDMNRLLSQAWAMERRKL